MFTYNPSQRIKTLLFMLMVACPLITLHAQQIKGKIVDTSNKAISYATVIVSKDSVASQITKYYAVSDGDGLFSISLPENMKGWLIARCMGYQTKTVPLCDKSDYVIQMDELSQSLDEVTVKANYAGVKFAGDTIKFDTNHFRIGTESTIGDVIKRMPGMEVSNSGQVSYAGKKIDKLLIDGNDVFSSGNNMAINTMSADAMAGAELFTNYKTGSLADDVLSQDRMALNIKTSGKSTLTGSANLSGGYKNKYQGRASMLNIGNKTSFNTLLAVNNVGVSAFSIEEYLNNVVGMDNIVSSGKNTVSISQDESKMLMTPDNVFKQTSGSATTGINYMPNDAFKIKANVLYAGNMLNSTTQSCNQYFESNQVENKTTDENDKNHYLNAQFQEQWKLSSKLEMNAETHINYNRYNALKDMLSFGLNEMKIGQNELLKKTAFKQFLGFNAKVGKGLAYLNLSAELEQKDRCIDIQTDCKLLPVIYDSEQQDYFLYQCKDRRTQQFTTEVGYLYPLMNKMRFRASSSYKYDRKSIEIDKKEIFHSNTFGGLFSVEKYDGLFRYSLAAQVSHMDFCSKKNTYLSPSANLQLVFSHRHKLMFSSELTNEVMDIDYLTLMDYINNYHSMNRASKIENPFYRQMNLLLNYQIFDMFSNTMFIFRSGYKHGYHTATTHTDTNGMTSESYYNNDGSTDIAYVRMQLQKGLGFIPVDATLAGGSNYTSRNSWVNNTERIMKQLSYNTKLNLRTRFESVLNGELYSSYSSTNYKWGDNDYNSSSWKIGSAINFVAGNFSSQISASYDCVSVMSLENRTEINLGAKLEYKFSNWSVNAEGVNLLHLNGRSWQSVSQTTYYQSTNFYQKIPGYVTIGLSCKI